MNNIYILFAIISQEIKQQWKGKFLQTIVIFAGIIIYASLLLSAMAVEQDVRVLSNFGLGFIELAAIIAVLFSLSGAIIKDIESKTIYLILSRPVQRWVYLVGKYAGVVLSVILSIAVMGVILSSLLFIKKQPPDFVFLQILLSTCLKIMITGALALFFSLVSTSVLSSFIITGIFYTLGHFMAEIKYISQNLSSTAKIIVSPLQFIIPNMTLFNLNDILHSSGSPTPHFAGWGNLFSYAFIYSTVCIIFAVLTFRKREF